MRSVTEVGKLDRESVLHPFTRLKEFASGQLGNPTVMQSGRGVRVRDAQGNEYLDGFAGLYCVNIGYVRQEVVDTIARQAAALPYYHFYAGHTTEGLAVLSSRLIHAAPAEMSKVFFGLSGSDANETQAKLVWYYNNLRGFPHKKKIIARERGYHGCTVISGSMTGMSFYHNAMDLPLPIVLRTGVPHYSREAMAELSEEEFSAQRAAVLEALILSEGPDTIGALSESLCLVQAASFHLRKATGQRSKRSCDATTSC